MNRRSRLLPRGRTGAKSIALVVAGGLVLGGCGARTDDESAASEQVDSGISTEVAPDGGATTADTGVAPAAGAAANPGQPAAGGTTTGTGGAAQPGAGKTGGQSAGKGSTDAGGKTPTKTAASDTITITGPDSQGVTDTSIKIGVLAPISGAAGFLGQNQVDGVNGYFSDTNAKGGVNGRTFKTVVVDTAFDPAAEATGARQLVEQEKVFAMIGVLGDSSAPYVTSKGIPNVVLGIIPPAYSSKYPTTYPVTLNTIQSVVAMAYYLKKVKKDPINSVGILYDTQNMNIKPWVSYLEKAWTVHGVKVASSDAFNLSDANCDQVVTKVRNAKIDFWQAGQSLGWPICLAAAARQNYKPPFGIGGPYSADAKFVGGAGKGSDGVYAQMNGVQIAINTGQPYPGAKSNRAPEVDNYVRTMKTYSPNSADIGSLENIWTQDGWAMAKLIVEAVSKQADAVTWKGFNQYVQGLGAWQSGLLQPIDFRPNCKTGAEPWIFQWKRQPDGSLVQSAWQPYGGMIDIPLAVKNLIVPGAGDCYVSRMADLGLK